MFGPGAKKARISIGAVALVLCAIFLPTRDAAAVVGGALDADDTFDFVVRIAIGTVKPASCSGVAIGPTTVLTSAHCFGLTRAMYDTGDFRPQAVEVTSSGRTKRYPIASAKIDAAYFGSDLWNQRGRFAPGYWSENFGQATDATEADRFHEVYLRNKEITFWRNHDLAVIETSRSMELRQYPKTIDRHIDLSNAFGGGYGSFFKRMIEFVRAGDLEVEAGRPKAVVVGFGLSKCRRGVSARGMTPEEAVKNCSADGKRRYARVHLARDTDCSLKYAVNGEVQARMGYAPWCFDQGKKGPYATYGDSGGPLLVRLKGEYVVLGLFSGGSIKQSAYRYDVDGESQFMVQDYNFKSAASLLEYTDSTEARSWIDVMVPNAR